jgi:hypothetical protein
MLENTLLTIIYVLFVAFHNVLFFVFFIGLIRIFIAKHTPYEQTFVGYYLMCHSFYGGCPMIEVENYFARLINVETKIVGDLYYALGDFGSIVRILFFITSLLLLYSGHRAWHKAPNKFNWSNLNIKAVRA